MLLQCVIIIISNYKFVKFYYLFFGKGESISYQNVFKFFPMILTSYLIDILTCVRELSSCTRVTRYTYIYKSVRIFYILYVRYVSPGTSLRCLNTGQG